MATHTFETNIPELIRRLGINLYNDALVAARELIQNANDACIMAEGLLGNPRGRIDVTINEKAGVMTVQDNGIGMTAEDLQKFLSTIASSKKAEVRRQLEQRNFQEARGIAGQFGIGFLSTFIIADKVEVFSRHQSERGPGSYWFSSGDGSYELTTSTTNLPRGTRIVLTIKGEFRGQLTASTISKAFTKYSPFIRTHYHINGSGLPVNHEPPPWDDPENAGLAESYLRTMFSKRPLIGFYISHDGPPLIPSDKLLKLRLRGYLAIPDESARYGDKIHVYTSGLHVGELRDGLPNWAGFVVGGIESPDIDLTLGRDNVMNNATWIAAKQVIARQLTDEIVKHLADPRSRLRQKWDAVFRVHGQEIMEGAVQDAQYGQGEFYRAVKDLIPFRIGNDRLSIRAAVEKGKCIERDGHKILFYHTHGSGRHESAGIQESLMFDEMGMHFIDAKNYYERNFIQKYGNDGSTELKLVPVEDGIEHLVSWDCEPGDATLIRDTFDALGIHAKLGRFRPSELAAVIIPVQTSRSDFERPDMDSPEGMHRLVELLMQKGTVKSHKPHTLCVNADNLLVQEMLRYCSRHGVDAHVKASFNQLYFMSLLVFGDTHTHTIAEMAPGLSSLMLSFIRRSATQEDELTRIRTLLAEERDGVEGLKSELAGYRKVEVKPNSVFVAYGYDEDTVKLVEPFKKMLRDRGLEPIDGKVDKAGSLSRQIVDRIRSSAMFVGILTPRDIIRGQKRSTTSIWVVEEKGVATAFGLPVLLVVDKGVAAQFYGNIEGDALRLEVEDSAAGWLSSFGEAVDIVQNTLKSG